MRTLARRSGPEVVKSANIHPSPLGFLLTGRASDQSPLSKHACKGDLCRFLFLREAEKAEGGGWNGPNSNLNDVGEAEIHGNEAGAAS